MNFQQLRSVREAVRRGFNLTEVAAALHTSQPGVSRQIRELEDELGVTLFMRAGKRLTGLTEPGTSLLPIIERLLLDSENLRQVSRDFASHDAGPLSLAATHSQARYALPSAVKDFRQLFPQVTLSLHQGSPRQIAQMLLSGEADIGIATEALTQYEQLITLPCYRWTHTVVAPPDHPLFDGQPLTLERLSRYPMVTYDEGYTGRSHIDEAFARAGIKPSIVLSAMDADVIKTYVELGMGVGIVASIAYDADRDRNLRALDAGHLFEVNMTRLAFRKGAFLRGYAYAFIETFAPPLTREVVEQAVRQAAELASV
ncbi:CysB family HTH-type transcriptional regulator [uncultured Aquabacterium sp.]|jgi:LysR family cys regulon transcriptional activator|uniref:CysB family HTH-type transcriptional regulator n=1 Tax=uncultured Aquabacterium sp. TaxID=158753 RepID=UPI00262E2A26|nr:CysB family HTH-type transcriptional regulator [uncultured Aquabacterium sp.]